VQELLNDPAAFMVWSILVSAAASVTLVTGVAVLSAKLLDLLVRILSEKGSDEDD